MQYLIGLFLILFSNHVHNLIEPPGSETSNNGIYFWIYQVLFFINLLTILDIYILTGIFFVITFFAATQDIVYSRFYLFYEYTNLSKLISFY